MSGETANFHARYLYRDYLQVAECDLTGETPEVVRSYIWAPSEPEATRVLSMTRWEVDGTQEKEHLYCMHDAMKNVTSLFGEARGRRALYEYRPYGGLITSEGNMAEENKFRFSSEYMDDELGLIYYNYRHLNPHDGRWISRDPIMEQGGWNLYLSLKNNSHLVVDYLGTIPPPGGFWTGTTGYESLRIPSSAPSNSKKRI
ncbi:RHS repeat-associated core domain-containing protein [uncultured Akkermansia sp.]|uniref:RHS repeat domain-containing protein n=1 Tax=uncultured Akkermansia sp. TaxID=512294 RepID=UPI00261ADF88|nr:RHS repeat-associated core domain-containing protein [uncultured Akkermansia sp.]